MKNTDKNENNIVLAPDAGNGNRDDINAVLKELNVRHLKSVKNDWVSTRETGDTVRMLAVNIVQGLVPDVRGMSLRDAIYVIENSGLRLSSTERGGFFANLLNMEPGLEKVLLLCLK